MSTDTHLLIRLSCPAPPLDYDGHMAMMVRTARQDRIFIVHKGEEIEVSHLCRSWAASASVNELRTATVQFLFPRIVEGPQ